MTQIVKVPEGLAGERLDVVLSKLSGSTRSQVQKQIKSGLITRDGEPVDSKQAAVAGESFSIADKPAPSEAKTPSLQILYEDNDIMAVDKPAGLAVHPTESGRVQPTVAAFAKAHGVIDEDSERPGIVHRLDKDTSGVLLIAKTPLAKQLLQQQFKQRSVKKSYLALVRGRLKQPEAVIELPIGRSRAYPTKRAVVMGGRSSKTHYKVLEELPGSSLLEIDLLTGRTHQIRVHFSHLGHPVMGDSLYGGSTPGLKRQFLHAAAITFTGVDGKVHTAKSQLPAELQTYLDDLGKTV